MQLPEPVERAGFAASLYSPWFFRNIVRPELYKRCTKDGITDPEDVHNLAVEMANRYIEVLDANRKLFDFPTLTTRIKNIDVQPFGTAVGMDKNGDGLMPFSYVYGFMKLGTVVLDPREGNDKPRVAVDDANDTMYNAQGFPHKGLTYTLANLIYYKKSNAPKKPVIVSVCGLPYLVKTSGKKSFVPNRNRFVTDDINGYIEYKEFKEIDENKGKALENAFYDTSILFEALNKDADGFEWNIFSPNTDTLPLMRTPENFERYANLARSKIGDKLLLAKMGPYLQEKRDENLKLEDAWLRGGGDGVTKVNTLIVPKTEVPSKDWKYPSAGKSGVALQEYRMRGIIDTRAAFPDAIIFTAGGIQTGEDCMECFDAGANAVEDYTPSTFYGFGLQRQKKKYVDRMIRREGFSGLTGYLQVREFF